MTVAALRRLGLVAVVAGAFCAPATAALAQVPAPPPPGIGVTLLEGPANAVDDPRAHEYIVDHLAPGSTILRKIGYSNGTEQPVDLTFYAVGAKIQDGSFVPGAGHATNDLSTWTTFSPTAAIVQPGETLPVTVTIAVPADAGDGERYAAALAEHGTAVPGGFTSITRVGIRIYLSVGTGEAPITAFAIDSITAKRDLNGDPVITGQVHNTGERAIDLSGQVKLTNGPSSLSAGPFAVRTIATLRPGESGDVTVDLDRALPSGPWDARITLASGVTSASGTARVRFPTGAGVSAPPTNVGRSGATNTGPAADALAVSVVLCLLALAGLARHRRRRSRSESDGSYQRPVNTTQYPAPQPRWRRLPQ
jgi:hypothetical protein